MEYIFSLVSLIVCACFFHLTVRWWKKPLYMMNVNSYSPTALKIEKAYKIVMLSAATVFFLVLSMSLFVVQFQKPLSQMAF